MHDNPYLDNLQYIVVDDHTLCSIVGEDIAQILAGDVHGYNWRDGTVMIAFKKTRPATKDDFKKFRVQLPKGFKERTT